MIAWGVASGTVLGALFPLTVVIMVYLLTVLTGGDTNLTDPNMRSVWVMVGFFAGLVIGGIAGLIMGFITGIVLAAMTYRAFSPLTDSHRYQRVVEIMCIIVGGALSLLLVVVSGLSQYGARGWGAEYSWLVWGVTPTLMATMATWWAGRHVATWVVATTSKAG